MRREFNQDFNPKIKTWNTARDIIFKIVMGKFTGPIRGEVRTTLSLNLTLKNSDI